MATKKKLLQAAAGSAGGAGPLNVEDVFSSYVYRGSAGSQNIENKINLGQSNSGSSIFFPDYDGDRLATASLPQFTGVFTVEFWFFSHDSGRAVYLIDNGVRDTNFSIQTNYLTDDHLFVKVAGASFSYTTAGLNATGWNHIAVVRDSSNNVATFVNGTRRGTPTAASGTVNGGVYYIGSSSTGLTASGYEPMFGHMSSVRISDNERYSTSSTSITVPTSEFTSDSNTVLLLGQGDTPLADASSNAYSITTYGNPRASEVGPFTADDAGEGGLVWIKNRSTTVDHCLTDTERGATKFLVSNTNDAESTNTSTLSSFNSTGFTIGDNSKVNSFTLTDEFVSWTWRKAPRYFDVVTYVGTGSQRTVSHNLDSEVGFIAVKRVDNADSWHCFHRSLGANKHIRLNTTGSTVSDTQFPVVPTSTEFTVSGDGGVNANGETYVAYLFAHNDDDGGFGVDEDQDIIKCGTYTGNGGSQEIDIGFEPQWILVKNVDNNSANWVIFDAMINWRRDNGQASYDSGGLEANTTDAESSGTFARFHPSANGFGFISEAGTWLNSNGNNFIYVAIRRGLMATPEDATKVFAIDDQGESTAPFSISNFPVDFVVRKNTTGANTEVFTRLTQNRRLIGNSTNAEDTDNVAFFDFMEGALDNTATSTTRYSYMWRRAPGFFDVVSYAGNGFGTRTISHNLGIAPEMIWVKIRNTTGGWAVYHSGQGNTEYAFLNQNFAFSSLSTAWSNTTPTADNFTVGSSTLTNGSGDTYIAYLFGTVDGVSKVGSYTGQNDLAYQTIDCGFTNGARFVLIKRADSTGDWFMFDTVSGSITTTANDTFMEFNTSNSSDTETSEWNSNVITPHSSGFRVVNDFNILNHEYIFYAIA